MQGNCEVCSTKKIPWMEAEIQNNCTLLHVRCSSLLIDRNQTYTVCSACVEIARFEASAKSLELKPRYRRQGTLLDICFYPQNEHNTLNTMHSFIYYNLMRPFASADVCQNHSNINGYAYWGRGLSFTVKTLKIHKHNIISYEGIIFRYIELWLKLVEIQNYFINQP